tara:strand:- start:171 stop:6371 length:6201 start_codon:yes stop_codon:yes gene_type:complete
MSTITTRIDKLDFLFKNKLGRVGFDNKLPWYEENDASPELIPAHSIMTDKLPFNLPALVRGGRIQINLNNNIFDSNGRETSSDDGVVRARIRLPLRPVNFYEKQEGLAYVFACDELKDSCKQFGYVVETLRNEENVIEITENDFYVLNNHVIFSDSTLSVNTTLFVSFYEYIGARGVIVDNNSTREITTTAAIPNETKNPCTSDDLHEGIFNLFYNDLRFKESFSNMTTDDLKKGNETLENERISQQTRSQELDSIRQQIPSHISELLPCTEFEQFNSNIFKSYFDGEISNISTDDVKPGANNKYLSESTLLETIENNEIITTSVVRESPGRLYFTAERTKQVLEENLSSFAQKIETIELGCTDDFLSVNYDITNIKLSLQQSQQETNARQEQIQNTIQTLSTDAITEGTSNLYYTDERVFEHSGFISVSAIVQQVREKMEIPPTQTELLPVLENWFSEKSLDQISDGENRKLISHEQVDEKIFREIPKSTDDISEGSNNKFFSDTLVTDLLKKTSCDILLEGESTYKSSKVRTEIQNRIQHLTLDEILDGDTYSKLSVGDIVEIVHNNLTPITQDINDLNSRLTQEKSVLSTTVENLNVPSIQLRLDAEILSLQANLNSVDERLQESLQQNVQNLQNLNTSLIAESTTNLYFNYERCLSVCEPLVDSAISICERSLTPLNTKIAEFKTQLSNGDLVISSLVEKQESLQENASVAFLSVSAHLQDLETSQMNNKDTLTELISASDNAKDSITEIRSEFPPLVSEIDATNIKLNEIHGEITENFEILQTWKNGIDSWKNNFLQVTTENLIENNAHLFFNTERSLSVHQPLYDRVSAVESNLTSLKTSSSTLSDDRLKSNEIPISDGISVLNSLNPLKYKMVLSIGQDQAEAFDDVGFIAQDVAQIDSLAHAVVTGTETIPFSLDYHSIITYAVAAVKEIILSVSNLDTKYDDLEIELQQDRSNFTSRFAENLRTEVSTDDLQEGAKNKFAPEFTGISLKLEEFKFLLQQIDTDQIPQGIENLYHKETETVTTTDDVLEGTSLYFTPERCQLAVNETINDIVSNLTVDSITETNTKGFLTLSRLLHELKFVTADHIGNGLTNRFLNLDTFLDLQITTDNVPEGQSNLYMSLERVRETVTGMSIDSFVDGHTNLFCSRDNVQVRLASLNTNDLPEAPGKRYVSRDAFFELHISVGDILDHDTLARKHEVEEQLQHSISVSQLTLETKINQVNSTLNLEILSTNSTLSISHSDLQHNLSTSHNALSQDIHLNQNEINNLHSLLSSNSIQIESNNQLLNHNTLSLHASLSLSHATLSNSHSVLQNSLSTSHSDLHNTLSTSHNALSQDINLNQNEINHLFSLVSTNSNQIQVNNQLINNNTLSINKNTSSILDVSLKVEEVDTTLSLGFLSLSNNLSSINQNLNQLTTAQVDETSTRKYVSKQAMTDMNITSDEIVQGNSNKYTTAQNVKDVLAHLTTSDLPEDASHPYVSKNNIINTGIKPNELNGFSNSIDAHLSTISADKLPEGNVNQYFTQERVLDALSIATTNDLIEGSNNKYFTNDRVHAILSTSSSSDIKEGSNLYFTANRVLEAISIATTDALPQGTTNFYLTKQNLLSLNIDVSELNDSSSSLLTTNSFLSQVNNNLSTDLVQEGNKKYVSSESVLSVLQENTITTDNLAEGNTNTYFTHERVKNVIDETFESRFNSIFQTKSSSDLPEGDNLYFTEQALTQTLTSSHIINTGITAENIGARPSSLSINALEIVETQNAFFFNSQRFDQQFQQKTTDDLAEGNKLFFSTDKVKQALQSIGDLSVALASTSPGELEVLISVSDDQVLGAKIHLLLQGENFVTQHEFELTNNSISKTFTNLNPEAILVSTTLQSRYGSQTNEQQIVVNGNLPFISDITFEEITPGFSDKIIINLGGHGRCDLLISTNNYQFHSSSHNLFEESQIKIDLSCIFDIANFTLQKNGVVLQTVSKQMEFGLVLPMKQKFNIITNSHFDALQIAPFSGILIHIQDDTHNTTFDGNMFHSNENPSGAIISASQNFINFGTSTGSLKTSLLNAANTFVLFT